MIPRNLKAALRYAELGWPVLPLQPTLKVPLGRLVPNGAKDATADPRAITEWWRLEPHANIGIACESLLVVDVDPRNEFRGPRRADGPHVNIWTMFAEHGPFRCPTVTTWSGGDHYFFRRPNDELKSKLVQGVDLVHGPHRYVVGAPSYVVGEGTPPAEYRWVSPRGLGVSDAPEWLLRLARRPPPTPLPPRASGDQAIERARRYLAKVDPAVSGANGHNHTFRVCCAIARKFELSEQDALSLLLEWNARCEPPWSTAQLQRKLQHALGASR